MTQIIGMSADAVYHRLLQTLLEQETTASPRGLLTKEILGVQIRLINPSANIVCHPVRRMQYPFSVAEWLWIMLGWADSKLIVPYNKALAKFANEYGTFDGAYGPRFIQQLPYVLNTLDKDPDSRQAVIDLWHPSPRDSRDIPCTLNFQFLIRDDPDHEQRQLHLIVNMRSNDAWLGFPYDIFNFTQIQRYVAMQLGVEIGSYVHNVGSMHLYDKNWDQAESLVNWLPLTTIEQQMPLVLSPPLTPMPHAFKSVALGLPLMSTDETAADALGWIQTFSLPEPWQTYLELLAYRFHKQLEYVPDLYQELIRGQGE